METLQPYNASIHWQWALRDINLTSKPFSLFNVNKISEFRIFLKPKILWYILSFARHGSFEKTRARCSRALVSFLDYNFTFNLGFTLIYIDSMKMFGLNLNEKNISPKKKKKPTELIILSLLFFIILNELDFQFQLNLCPQSNLNQLWDKIYHNTVRLTVWWQKALCSLCVELINFPVPLH